MSVGGGLDVVGDEVSDEVLLARVYLSRVAERACVALWSLVREVGPVEAAARVRAQDGIPERLRRATRARHATVDPIADLLETERLRLRLVVPESRDWPHFAIGALDNAGLLRAQTFDREPDRFARGGEPVPPFALWVTGPGDLRSLGTRSVGIVGARTSTPYGEQIARSMARGLAERDVVVVSGGAYGIDKAAHRGALDVGGVTVLVSAGGLDRAYPVPHVPLYRRIRETGLLVSESPPGTPPLRHRFLNRNRLIACLSTGSVVVEAARHSGALNTIGHARTLGRPTMAVPGPVTSAVSVGCHDVLRRDDEPAALVTCADDVLEVIGSSTDLTGPRGEPPAPATGVDRVRRVLASLDAEARAVFEGIPAGRSIDVDDLVQASAVPVSDVLTALPGLELAGLVERDGARYRLRS